MIEIGRVCIKLAGRDAGKKCIIVDILDNNFVMIDGDTRRRKCNIIHLEPLLEVVKISKGASHDAVCKALELEVIKTNPKKSGERPKKQRKVKEVKPDKKVVKKAESLIEKVEKKAEKPAEKKTIPVEKPKKEPVAPVVDKPAEKSVPKKVEEKTTQKKLVD